VPLVNGASFIKWHLSHSTAAEHRGRTESCPIRDHKVLYNYDIALPVRLTIDKDQNLQESILELEVVQEYGSAGRGERITLGHVKLNLAEYVEQSDLAPADGDDSGVTRRYLMQNSKINSTLKLGIFMRQTEGDKNFIAPALKTAQVFSGIAGIMAGEQAELEDNGCAFTEVICKSMLTSQPHPPSPASPAKQASSKTCTAARSQPTGPRSPASSKPTSASRTSSRAATAGATARSRTSSSAGSRCATRRATAAGRLVAASRGMCIASRRRLCGSRTTWRRA
jgi:hypothetical protein